MTWWGWLALGAICVLGLLPTAAAVRVDSLATHGRLRLRKAGGSRRQLVALAASPRAAWPGGVAAVASVAVWGGVLLGAAAGGVLLTLGLLLGDLRKRRRATRRHSDLLSAVRVLVGELEAGAQVARALASAGAASGVGAVFVEAGEVARRGESPGDVLADDPDPDVRAIGLALRLSDTTGAALAGVVGRVAADLGAADEQRRGVAIVLAGPRASAFVLSCLPALGIGLGIAMGARPLAVLGGSTGGQALCCVGVLLDMAGILWMRRIVVRAERA